LYTIHIRCHTDIKCTKEHPFYVREKRDVFEQPIWKEAKDLNENDYLGMIINNKEVTPNFTFNKYNIILDKLEYWYMIGCFVGNKCTQDVPEWFNNILKMFDDEIIPEWVQDAPIKYIQEFINGYSSNTKFWNLLITEEY
jgi:intein/homing endonuclease